MNESVLRIFGFRFLYCSVFILPIEIYTSVIRPHTSSPSWIVYVNINDVCRLEVF